MVLWDVSSSTASGKCELSQADFEASASCFPKASFSYLNILSSPAILPNACVWCCIVAAYLQSTSSITAYGKVEALVQLLHMAAFALTGSVTGVLQTGTFIGLQGSFLGLATGSMSNQYAYCNGHIHGPNAKKSLPHCTLVLRYDPCVVALTKSSCSGLCV